MSFLPLPHTCAQSLKEEKPRGVPGVMPMASGERHCCWVSCWTVSMHPVCVSMQWWRQQQRHMLTWLIHKENSRVAFKTPLMTSWLFFKVTLIFTYLKNIWVHSLRWKPMLVISKEPNFGKVFIDGTQSCSQTGLLETQNRRTLSDSKQATFRFFSWPHPHPAHTL